MRIAKETEAEIVIGMGWFFRALGWVMLLGSMALLIVPAAVGEGAPRLYIAIGFGIPFLIFSLWVVSVSTKITFDHLRGGITVRRRYLPFVATTKWISQEEAKSAFVRSVRYLAASLQGSEYQTTYQVGVKLMSGEEITFFADPNRSVVDDLARRVRGFSGRPGVRA